MNKVAGAILVGLLLFMGVKLFSEGMFKVEGENMLASTENTAATETPAKAEAPKEVPLATLLASANPQSGERTFRKCQACHTAVKGAGNRVGPNLYGVVGRPVASEAGFAYSTTLQGVGGDWTYEELNKFLTNPQADYPGTKMTFAGLKKPEDRANVIAYLREQSDSPVPLPEAPADNASGDEASGENTPGE